MIDRDKFFDSIRNDPFNGSLTQSQVDGLNFLINVWEDYSFGEDIPDDSRDDDMRWLAYALATAFHETAQTMEPIAEYGEGQGKEYGEPAGPYNQCYYGRGYVQLTWYDNYVKGQDILMDIYEVDCPMVRYPHRMLEHVPAALILYDGIIKGWFTGVGLPKYFNAAKNIEDPYNARKTVNGLDCASAIEDYYYSFKKALT